MFDFSKPHSLSGYTLYRTVLNPKISKQKYVELREYASKYGILLEDFKDFTGDIQEIKDYIDKIVLVSQDFPLIMEYKKGIRLKLYFADFNYHADFAFSENHTISINGLIYDDTTQAKNLYEEAEKERHFVSGTTYKAVPFHELGHVVCNIYKFDPLTIAKKVTNINSTAHLIEYLAENLSRYATSMNDSGLTSKNPRFDGAEIIAECFCAYYSDVSNEFATAYVNECKSIVKGGRL